MRDEFRKYCEAQGVDVVELDDEGCAVELPRSAATIARFLANSPIPTDDEVHLFEGLDRWVDRDGLKLLEFDNWKLSAAPVGGLPPEGGVLRLTVKF
jgi:hypothetical protein